MKRKHIPCTSFSLIGLALAGSAGMTFLILACTLSKQQNWWPAIVTVFYLAVPFPLLIAKQIAGDGGGFGGQGNGPKEWAYFVTTGIIISALALPIVLCGVGTVSYTTNFIEFDLCQVLQMTNWCQFTPPPCHTQIQTGAMILSLISSVFFFSTILAFFMVFQSEDNYTNGLY